ncbi:MAG: glutathione S-transferase [Alphaproteobacteria bacterium]|nr:glutathione S-transferase [Alphaproteobacteria bacterium]
MTATLLTIPFSHFCEKARWAAERAGVDFVEAPHAPLLHAPFVRWAAGQTQVPVYIDDSGTYADSTDILRRLDAGLPEARRLFPEGDAETAALEDLFDLRVGPATRRIAYSFVLEDKPLAIRMTRGQVPPAELLGMQLLFPVARALIYRGYQVNAAGVARSLERLRGVMDEVQARLSDGRRYLTGERFTAADLCYASLMGVLLLPPEYGFPFPSPEETPPGLRDLCLELRAHPAGAYAMRLYAEDRR